MNPPHIKSTVSRILTTAVVILTIGSCLTSVQAAPSSARKWNEALLYAIRKNSPNPPAHARNLFHTAVTMYDCWSAYDSLPVGYVTNEKITPLPVDVEAAREEAISYAAYRLLRARFPVPAAAPFQSEVPSTSPFYAAYLAYRAYTLALDTKTNHDNLLISQYGAGAPATATAALVPGSTLPAEVGKRICDAILSWGSTDGFVNIAGGGTGAAYPQAYTAAVNPNLNNVMSVQGTNYSFVDNQPLGRGIPALTNPNLWQPLDLATSVDQGGNATQTGKQTFVGVQSLATTPFSLTRTDPVKPWLDPYGGPSKISTPTFSSATNAAFKQQILGVVRAGSQLNSQTVVNISPGAIGNNPLGTDSGGGWAINPVTNVAYAPNNVKFGDYARCLAEFWADGPSSETPPGHWHVLANEIADDPLLVKKIRGVGPTVNDLEWDVKVYFSLAGGVHDAACAAWSLKRYYSGPRPISLIRYLCDKGQSSDSGLPGYSQYGIPLETDVCEVITDDTKFGRHALVWDVGYGFDVNGSDNVGQIVVKVWPGEHNLNPSATSGLPATFQSPVRWVLGRDWLPFQRKTFNTPAFPGYISGHSTFSRSAAEVLTLITGSPDFPGAYHDHTILQNSLQIDLGPSTNITLQWRTYYDAADQAGQSRRYGGIHVSEDDFHGRIIGSQAGVSAYTLAEKYWTGAILEENMRPNVKVTGPTTAVLTWTATRGMKHKVQTSTNLATWTDATSAVVAYDTNGTWTDTSASVTKKFYRVRRTQ